ncbi:trypsin-like isoform X1 [Dermacentor andersoni]|uniref:trypsin-like isoform X1 n=1 Tax=Dermacentor andersoni TaxID=34620 RepID=UPI003B3A99C1
MAASVAYIFVAQSVRWLISAHFLASVHYTHVAHGDRINGPGCGISAPIGRIVNGEKVDRLQVPWIVYLEIKYMDPRKGRVKVKCGGSIISPSFILTAAHCLYSKRREPLGAFIYYNETRRKQGPRRRAEFFIRHPWFNNPANDIGLIKLRRPIPFDSFVHAVCLPIRNFNLARRHSLVAGWGRIAESGQSSDDLLYITREVLPFEFCKATFNRPGLLRKLHRGNVMCTSSASKDSCKGDSGGPLTTWLHGVRSVQVGIVSFGIGCARPDKPGVYTRVSAFVPWIKRQIAINCDV